MSDIINFSSRKKIQLVFDSLGLSNDEKQDDQEEILRQTAAREYEKGYQDCKNDLFNEFQEKAEQEIQEIKGNNLLLLNEINEQIELLYENLPKSILNVSLLIAEKIITKQVEINYNIREQVDIILKKVLGAAEITVKLNPEDIKLFGQDFNNFKIFPDENIERGGCFVETEIGNIDARISSRLTELKRAVEAELIENQ